MEHELEFTAQYCAVGGPGGAQLALGLVEIEAASGQFPGAADNFSGGPGWLTIWPGIPPEAWLYLCLDDGLFVGLSGPAEKS